MKNKSIFAGDDINVCYCCGRMGKMEEHHIFGSVACRSKSDKYGLLIHVCRICHDKIHGKDGKELRDHLHAVGQQLYEERYGDREQFIQEFIRSYL